MAEGWVLVAGVVALLMAIAIALAIMRRQRQPAAAVGRLATLGPVLVVMGIAFGEERLIAYGFMGAGVAVSIVGAVLGRRSAAR